MDQKKSDESLTSPEHDITVIKTHLTRTLNFPFYSSEDQRLELFEALKEPDQEEDFLVRVVYKS